VKAGLDVGASGALAAVFSAVATAKRARSCSPELAAGPRPRDRALVGRALGATRDRIWEERRGSAEPRPLRQASRAAASSPSARLALAGLEPGAPTVRPSIRSSPSHRTIAVAMWSSSSTRLGGAEHPLDLVVERSRVVDGVGRKRAGTLEECPVGSQAREAKIGKTGLARAEQLSLAA
jgi:hypothetical protein